MTLFCVCMHPLLSGRRRRLNAAHNTNDPCMLPMIGMSKMLTSFSKRWNVKIASSAHLVFWKLEIPPSLIFSSVKQYGRSMQLVLIVLFTTVNSQTWLFRVFHVKFQSTMHLLENLTIKSNGFYLKSWCQNIK